MVKMLSQLYNNQWGNMRDSLNMWKIKKIAIDNREENKTLSKKDALLKLESLLTKEKKNKVRQAVRQIQRNFNVRKAKNRVCSKISAARSQNYRSSFLTWKNLPYQEAKKTKPKAAKFQKSLVALMMRRLKEVNSTLRENGL